MAYVTKKLLQLTYTCVLNKQKYRSDGEYKGKARLSEIKGR